ncbi:sugar phosphate isomerase/epimerase [Vagococcus sp. BWB3-3]|uniref:Sugar phosphate isomerase/epimerase n=1 Tax=Vagococcus allomyrinae TaxID=2794353 RepID=A0A940SXC7_9ENTE|nr:sugar phosphate isomerase/epimerase [Vagococcus allomyrinae]MBP1043136.1 sugar phosphate isomerase/epimerase [Vagococcus allomyrinae]
MYKFPIGVMLESFRTDYEIALKRAVEVGAQGIQVHALNGQLTARNLTNQKTALFLSQVRESGLEISGLVADLMLHDKSKYPAIITEAKQVLDLAKELGTNIVTTHIGVIPADPTHDRFKLMQEACFQLAEYANSLDAHFAIETGPEIATTLKQFLEPLPGRGVAVNLDPANFVMVTGDDPVKAVHTLKDYIVHTHAKDGRKLLDRDPEVLYGMSGTVEDEIQSGQAFIELPLGKGDVDFPNYLKALTDIGYTGYLTIEREVGEQPEKDIAEAVTFLKQQTNQ